MKTSQFKPLQKTNDRWKWMLGATAAAAVATPHSQAQTAQISLINNQIDSVSGNSLSLSVSTGYAFGNVTHAFIANGAVNSFNGRISYDANVRFSLNGSPQRHISASVWHYPTNNDLGAAVGSKVSPHVYNTLVSRNTITFVY